LKTQKEIFVSYAWGGESESTVDEICVAFEEAGYKITRDKTDLTYRQGIKNFMNRIGAGSFIIAVISDKYLRSEYCMYEAYRIFQAADEFRQRVYPIVLKDAELFSFDGQKKYLQYWINESERLKKEIGEMAGKNPTLVIGLTERLRDYELTARYVNDFIATISDMNVISPEHHRSTNFRSLVEQMEAQLTIEDQTTEEKNNSTPNQSIAGGMNIGGGLNTGGDVISISGVGAGSNIAAGRGASVDITTTSGDQDKYQELAEWRKSIEKTIHESMKLDEDEKEAVLQQVEKVEKELTKADIDTDKIEKAFNILRAMSTDIFEVAIATIVNPIAGIGLVMKKVGDKVKFETQTN
jgi:hypothetical protein